MKVTLYDKKEKKEMLDFDSVPQGREYCFRQGFRDDRYVLIFRPVHRAWDWWRSVKKPSEPALKLKKKSFSWS